MGSSRLIQVKSNTKRVGILIVPALFFLAIFFEWLAFPSELITYGISFFGFLYPGLLFLAIRYTRPVLLPLWGALYAALETVAILPWLGAYHPGALLVTLVFTAILYALAFLLVIPLAKNKRLHLCIPIWFVGLQYIKTIGFLGNPYLSLGYSQAFFEPLRNLSTLGGIWLPALVLSFGGYIIQSMFEFEPVSKKLVFKWPSRRLVVPYLSATLALVLLSIPLQNNSSPRTQKSLLLVQHNMDPWLGGDETFKKSLRVLKSLTDEALLQKKPDLIVYSETAFIPAIEYHNRYRENPVRYDLVRELLDYFNEKKIPFLLGNDHGVRNPKSKSDRLDYNAALLFEGETLKQLYAKRHLVPFSEYFPYKDEFPGIYNWLKDLRTNFWEPGLIPQDFTLGDFGFVTPICYEDSFGADVLSLLKPEVDAIIVLVNDTWSNSKAAMIQHLAMSVFRANETGRPLVRASNGGATVLVDPHGNITFMAPLFEQNASFIDLPLVTNQTTPYMVIGDSLGIASIGVPLLAIVIALFRRARSKS